MVLFICWYNFILFIVCCMLFKERLLSLEIRVLGLVLEVVFLFLNFDGVFKIVFVDVFLFVEWKLLVVFD